MNADDPTIPSGKDPLHGNEAADLLRFALEPVTPSPVPSAWVPPHPEHLAQLLPQYQISALIGRGGMGAVYRGRQLSLNRDVAIKLLPSELAADPEFVQRFQREAQTLARLQHPGIIAVYDFGQTSEGHLYFVMEFVNGTDLHRIIGGPGLSPEQALEFTIQICEALHYSHREGVIHRDIKPANVLVTRDGRAKLADFGLARPLSPHDGTATVASRIMGTPDYMAPEQWEGKKGDHRADIYALGVMLYEMLTGTRPKGAFPMPSQRARVDARLDEVVAKAMSQEPADRYQQISELRQDVERIRTTKLSQTAVNPSLPKKTGRRRRGSLIPTWVWLAAAGILLVLGWIGRVTWNPNPWPKVAAPLQEAEPVIPPPVIPPAPDPAPAPIVEAPIAAVPAAVVEAKPVAEPIPVAPAPTPPPAPLAVPPSPVVVPAALPSAPPEPERPPLITGFSTEAPNLMAWTLAPLEEDVPPDIRQNLTFLREDLIDEGKKKPTASLDAYRAAYYLCEALIAALDERTQARVAAGFRAAQSVANQSNTNSALEARRNYMMSWPQYHREESQRAALRSQNRRQRRPGWRSAKSRLGHPGGTLPGEAGWALPAVPGGYAGVRVKNSCNPCRPFTKG
jgi:serine/threonine protein kinase